MARVLRRKLTLWEERDLALKCAREMVTYCEQNRQYGTYTGFTSIIDALAGIGRREYGFGDICDDNVFIHEVLSQANVISKSVSHNVRSEALTKRWNDVVRHLGWAAGELLRERQTVTDANGTVYHLNLKTGYYERHPGDPEPMHPETAARIRAIPPDHVQLSDGRSTWKDPRK